MVRVQSMDSPYGAGREEFWDWIELQNEKA